MTYKEPLTTTTQPGLITLAGDLGGAATSPTVVSITGASGVVNVAATGNIITWAAATTAPGLTQTAPGTDVAPADFHVTPQPNYASAVTNTRGGSAVVNLTTLIGSGSVHNGKGTFRVMDPNNGNTNLFEVTSAAFNGNGWSTTYFGSAGSAYISSGGGALQISGTGNNVLQYNAGTILGWNANGIGLGGVGSFAGGVNVISMLNETTLPTSLLSGTGSGLIMYSHNGQLEIDGYGINFHNLSQTPGIYQTAAASDVVPQNMTIKPQGPFASAVTNVTSGSVNINFPSPASGTTRGQLNIQENSVSYATIADVAAGTGTAAIWLGSGSSGTNATGANYVLRGSGTSTIVNASGGTLAFSVSSTQIVTINNVGVAIGTNIPNFGNATNALMLASGGTVSTVLIPGTTGLAAYSNNGKFEIDGYGIGFNALSVPSIYQTAAASGAGQNMIITPQAATTTGTSGSVIVNVAVPASGSTEAGLQFQRNGVFFSSFQGRVGNGGVAALYMGNAMTPAGANYSLSGDGTNTQLNAASGGFVSCGVNGGNVSWTSSNRNTGFNGSVDAGNLGGGININATTVNPTSNPTNSSVLYSEHTTMHFKVRGVLGATTTAGPSGSALTINTQAQVYDMQFGTCQTASSATPTTILTYTTTSTTAGFITLTAVSRATGTGAGIAIGNAATSVYTCAFENISGTVAVSAPALVTGTNVVVAGSVTAPVIAATVATNVITFTVVNTALAQIDSQVTAEIVVC